MSLMEALAKAMQEDQRGGRDNDGDRPSMSTIGQIANLREFLTDYTTPCPFKVGDLVVPKSNSTYRGGGKPHMVVDQRSRPASYQFDGEAGSNNVGERLDIRVAHVSGEHIATHWVESHRFEPFVGETDRKNSSSNTESEASLSH